MATRRLRRRAARGLPGLCAGSQGGGLLHHPRGLCDQLAERGRGCRRRLRLLQEIDRTRARSLEYASHKSRRLADESGEPGRMSRHSHMKYVTEYRDRCAGRTRVIDEIRRTVTRPWTLMEICGGQTHAIVRYGIDQLLPPEIELVHGPGCPVCVTPLELIDKALAIASRPGRDLLLVRRHAARAGLGPRSLLGQGRRRRCARGLFAAGCGRIWHSEIQINRLFSLRLALRPPRRRT